MVEMSSKILRQGSGDSSRREYQQSTGPVVMADVKKAQLTSGAQEVGAAERGRCCRDSEPREFPLRLLTAR